MQFDEVRSMMTGTEGRSPGGVAVAVWVVENVLQTMALGAEMMTGHCKGRGRMIDFEGNLSRRTSPVA